MLPGGIKKGVRLPSFRDIRRSVLWVNGTTASKLCGLATKRRAASLSSSPRRLVVRERQLLPRAWAKQSFLMLRDFTLGDRGRKKIESAAMAIGSAEPRERFARSLGRWAI
jgi:hypothetical protein